MSTSDEECDDNDLIAHQMDEKRRAYEYAMIPTPADMYEKGAPCLIHAGTNQVTVFNIQIGKGKTSLVFSGLWQTNLVKGEFHSTFMVAIKWILPQYASNIENEKQICRAASKSKLMCFTKYYGDYDYKQNRITRASWLFMESLQGYKTLDVVIPTLSQTLSNNLEFYNRVIEQLITAIGYLHTNNIVHGDIRCSNVLVGASYISHPYETRIVLIDFGSSQFIHDVIGTRQEITNMNMRMKSDDPLFYKIPLKAYDYYVSDIWAFGITCYKLLYAELPYDVCKSRQNCIKYGDFYKVWSIAKQIRVNKKHEFTLIGNFINFTIGMPDIPNIKMCDIHWSSIMHVTSTSIVTE